MSGSNSKAMTLEDRVVEEIKTNTLGKIVDADSILSLVDRAIREVLFKPRVVSVNSWGQQTTVKSLVEEAAETVAKQYASDLAESMIKDLLADDNNRNIIAKTIVDLLPAAITGHLNSAVKELVRAGSASALMTLGEMQLNGQPFMVQTSNFQFTPPEHSLGKFGDAGT